MYPRYKDCLACLSEQPCIWGTFCSTQAQNPKKQIRLGKYVSASKYTSAPPKFQNKKVNGLSVSAWAYLKPTTSIYVYIEYKIYLFIYLYIWCSTSRCRYIHNELSSLNGQMMIKMVIVIIFMEKLCTNPGTCVCECGSGLLQHGAGVRWGSLCIDGLCGQ